jgi:Transcription factor WhiB
MPREMRQRHNATGQEGRPLTISSAPGPYQEPAELTDEELHSFVVSPLAACADSALDPDDWFPIATAAARARAEASSALAVCAACPVRAECLELSLRHWRGVGRHGIWGGLVETDRNALRREWLKGVPVKALLSGGTTVPRPRQPRQPDVPYEQLPQTA